MSTQPQICQALNVSDEKPCQEAATSKNGLFCPLHSKQALGLYLGYKRRNAQLDKLSASPPQYLAESELPLSNQLFSNIETEELCKELHDYLFQKLQLLIRVIKARKLHHSRFFPQNYDYDDGHVNYLNHLQNQRQDVTKALERIERRTAEVLYYKQSWFTWVRECQDEEEANREKEQKKVKQEAAMFKRNWKEVQQRLEELRVKEWHKKQDAALEQAYRESLSEDDSIDYDPIEDYVEDNRENYIDLIKRFLWMSMKSTNDADTTQNDDDASKDDVDTASKSMADLNISAEVKGTSKSKSSANKSKKSKGKKKKPQKSSTKAATEQNDAQEPSAIETRAQMYDRLKNGVDYSTGDEPGYVPIMGVRIGGTLENPEIDCKTTTYPEAKVEKLLSEIADIKHLLFCRLLLGHATLLPAALRADTVEDFLADPEVTEAALRDLSLKMERPGLQEIRDACADLFRDNEAEDLADSLTNKKPTKKSGDSEAGRVTLRPRPQDALPKKWISEREKKREMARERGELGDGTLDFGGYAEVHPKNRIRVKLCGRTIWNYPSSKAMNRRGWLHFCILAKDSSLHEAITLCRHWDEFYELNLLAIYDYFPSGRWARWCGQRHDQQLKELGFIVYAENQPDAETTMRNFQRGPHSAKYRKVQAKIEYRNWMCAYMKRDDPISRRFLQYLSMNSDCFLLIRNAETGQILVKPPEDQRWLARASTPMGNFPGGKVQDGWDILQEIGPKFFEEMDKFRNWNFSFKEYYDVYVWNKDIGEPFAVMYNEIYETLMKAHRVKQGSDMHKMSSLILKELTWDEKTKRIRDLEPDETEKSVWDWYNSSSTRFLLGKAEISEYGIESRHTVTSDEPPPIMFYNEADALEDEILFPEEKHDPLATGKITTSRLWEEEDLLATRYLDHLTDSDSGNDSGEEKEDSESTTDGSDEDFNIDGSDEDFNIDAVDFLNSVARMSNMGLASQQRTFNTTPSMFADAFRSDQFKEHARVCKESWHEADDLDGQKRYKEMLQMGKAARKYASRCGMMGPQNMVGFSTCHYLDPGSGFDHSPDDQKDMMKAVYKLSPFFLPGFKKSKEGRAFQDSLLLNQEQRAKSFADFRCYQSTTEIPREFWKDWDKIHKDMKTRDDLPLEWDKTIRPILARLYKAGIIRMKREEYPTPGQAIAAKDPISNKMDLFIDYRETLKWIKLTDMGPQTHPASIPAFLPTARAFAQKHSSARFAILRIWSAAHFYPLMLGPEPRPAFAFEDMIGRNYNWMFIPKAMPFSEYSIHSNCENRIKPYKHLFGKKVVAKRDQYLVMGVDEKELVKLATAVTFAVQRNQWRLEIDLWKSFVNVDIGFLENMPEKWFI